MISLNLFWAKTFETFITLNLPPTSEILETLVLFKSLRLEQFTIDTSDFVCSLNSPPQIQIHATSNQNMYVHVAQF